ncbi:winged helix-turn-helix transcriptional regulator [Kitasatospora kifunensis]|uniref:DNA-binding HxlR family transcriptional regulator n=1 Tax=Kitasatospora kifunensis TaxID=58351 RepID=A0A7W7QXJ7_KITKI|nr:helix-turn-helix domain-containing protein [Kitasatospora kifunensis]MBB4921617.1 DNA-binding HxlR family transcriptional regulator [Kitasatospora kifunensis]
MATESTAGIAAGHPEEALPYDVFGRACPSRCVLKNVTHAWGSLTLAALYDGTFRFNELRRRVEGVSEKMLSQTLHALERDGLVHRDAQLTNPPRVDYRLTDLGREVAGRLIELISLVEERMPEVEEAQRRYDEGRA